MTPPATIANPNALKSNFGRTISVIRTMPRIIRTLALAFAWGGMAVAWWLHGAHAAAVCAFVGMVGVVVGADE